MGLNVRTIETLTQRGANFTKLEGVLFTKPKAFGAIKPAELKLAPLKTDVVQFSENILKTPSAEKLKFILDEHGLQANYVNNNNSLFLEELTKQFPLKQGETKILQYKI